MPDTQTMNLHTKLMPTDLTYGSGGWQVQEWYAYALAPGKIISWDPAAPSGMPKYYPTDWVPPFPIKFSPDNSYLHYLYNPANIAQLAKKYFNLNISKNPYVQDNFVLAMLTKNGGPPNVDVLFPIVCETQPFSEKTVKAASEPVRLAADQLDILGRLGDTALAPSKEGFEQLLERMIPERMTPAQEKLFRDEARAIFDRESKK